MNRPRRNKKLVALVAIFVGLSTLTWPSLGAYELSKKQVTAARMLVQLLYTYHAEPVKDWDLLSEHIFNVHVKSGDARQLFWQSDVEALKKHERSIDEQLRGPELSDLIYLMNGTNLLFLSDYVEVVRRRAKEATKILEGIRQSNWDYSSADDYEPNPMHRTLPNNANDARRFWEFFVRHEVLEGYYQEQLALLGAKSEDDKLKEIHELARLKGRQKAFLEAEPNLRNRVVDENHNKLKRLLGASMEQWFQTFLRNVIVAHDAHSYLLLGSGEWVRPAYSNGFEIRPPSSHQVEGYGEGKPKASLPTLNAALIRLEGKTGAYGYLGLNSFVSNQQFSPSKRVLEALERLENNSEGLVLDLRNNPGGFIEEALKVLGYFVGRQPSIYYFMTKQSTIMAMERVTSEASRASLKQYKNFSGSKMDYFTYMEEASADQVYQKPLVVLVNEQTASAGELSSSALRDLRRGVVVGGERTFGKGTGQLLFNVNDGQGTNFSAYKAKLTVLIYYRVTGDSIQPYGLRPDIVLPSAFNQLGGVFESELFNILDPLPIKTAPPTNPSNAFEQQLKAVQANSKQRVLHSEYFRYIKRKSADPKTPLSYKAFMAQKYKEASWHRGLAALRAKPEKPPLTAEALPEDKHAPPEPLLRALERDPYVGESYEILDELQAEPSRTD